ncbi:hypothetical protein DYQ86_12820 [Acidobacteria bacterium AB60]|nr:hypothetical protein DYQ86_12820 [Acidobacteria bacterium AB60]
MQKVFGGTTLEPLEKRRDKELTLGPTTLMLLGLGLLALCGVCFVFGYAVGQHGSPVTPAAGLTALTAKAGVAPTSTASSAKPAPSQNSFQPKPAAPATDASTDATEDTPRTVSSSKPSEAPAAPREQVAVATSPAPQAQTASMVQTALPGASGGALQPAVASGPAVRPALPQSSAPAVSQPGTWMVQIAAVSHPEDAEVLVSALRKHGYAVAVHRDPVDALIHVQVGPFPSRSDAAAMRQKLLNDGYNAIVQP